MYILFVLFAISVPALAIPNDTVKVWETIPKLPDIYKIFSNLESTNPNSTCFRDFKRFIFAAAEEDWAKKMLDSMEKIPYGLFHGRTSFMGSFDECISANEGNFSGKYCLADLVQISDSPPPGPGMMSYGICLPSTCTAAEIQSALDDFGFQEVNLTFYVFEKNCYTSEPVTLPTESWITIYVLIIFGIIAVSSTVFDVMHQYDMIKSDRYELYSSFSLYSNGFQMVKINNGPSNLGCLHGIRSLTMCWIILCHEYCMGMFAPLMNSAVIISDFLFSKYKIPITNGFVAVDTFFLLSGLLVTLVFFRSVSKSGSYDVPVAIIHRFIRLSPAFAAMMLIQATIVPYLGRGPFWNKLIGMGVEACKESWWSGLLYIQNLVKPTSSCLGQSWYLSSDMQMFWLSPLLLYPLLLWRMKGIFFAFFALAAALTTNFVISVIYELGPQLLTSKSVRQFDTDYVQTHMRLTPYIIGMAVGYIICGMKANKIRVNLSRTWIVAGWLMSAALCLGSMFGVIYFLDNDYGTNYALASSYLTFHRLGWSLGLAWVIFACIAGYGGPVDYFLSWNCFQVIGKISYCMFLVHFTVQMARVGMSQTNFLAHDFFFVSNFLSTMLFSILFAVPLYLFFEAPFSNLDRYFLRNLKILPFPKKKEEEGKESKPQSKEQQAAP